MTSPHVVPAHVLLPRISRQVVNWELQLFSGAQHGFTNPSNASEERADREYKVTIERFFKEIFGRS
jgi:hypothetical protein